MSRDDEPLVTIVTFPTGFEASLARGALERIGIAALVPDEASGTFPTYSRQPAGSALKVLKFEGDRAIASTITDGYRQAALRGGLTSTHMNRTRRVDEL